MKSFLKKFGLMDDNTIKKHLKSLSKGELIDALIKVYQYGNYQTQMVVENLCAKNDPEELINNLQQVINRWLYRKKFISYSESFDLARQIEVILEQLEELLSTFPEGVFRLADKIVRSDGKIMNAVDDSSGSVGDVMNEFPILWLKAAVKIPEPKKGWLQSVIETAEGDEYGCRNHFLENVNLLLTKEKMHELIIYFRQKASEVKKEKSGFEEDYKCFKARIDMQQVAVALKDPELYEEAERISRSNLNNRQMVDIIKCYLRFERIDKAIELLKSTNWEEQSKIEALDLEKQALEKKGEKNSLRNVLLKLYKASPSISRLKDYYNVLDKKEREVVIEEALKNASRDKDLQRGLEILINFEKYKEAQQLIIKRSQELDNFYYTTLIELLKPFKKSGFLLAQVCIYRTLLLGILNVGRSKAYGYAARYYSALGKLDGQIECYPSEMDSHEIFLNFLREEHGKKWSFWERVEKKKNEEI